MRRLSTILAFLALGVFNAAAATKPPSLKLTFTSDSKAPNTAHGEDWLYSIVQTSDGGFLAGGFTEIDNGAGAEYHAALLKLDPSMALQWEKALDEGELNDVIDTPSRHVATGDAPGGLLVVSVDHANAQNVQQFVFSQSALGMSGLKGLSGYSIVNVVDANGADQGYIVAALAEHFTQPRFTTFLLRLNPDFTAQPFGGNAGGVVSLGETVCKRVRLMHAANGALSGFIAAGTIPSADEDDVGDVYFARVDLNGIVMAKNRFKMSDLVALDPKLGALANRPPLCANVPTVNTAKARAWDVVETANGGDFVAAIDAGYRGIPDATIGGGAGCTNVRLNDESYVDLIGLLMRLSPALAPRWLKDIGRFSGIDYKTPMVMMKDGFIVAGNDATQSETAVTARLVKTNFAGDVIWTGDYLVPGDRNDCAFGVARTSDDALVVAGNNDRNGDDYFALKVAPDCIAVPSDIRARYPFNDTAASAQDVAFGTNAVWFNGPKPVPAVVRTGLSFDGVDDYAEAPARSPIQIGFSDFTIAGWMRVDPADGGGPIRSVLDKRTRGNGPVTGYHVAIINGVLWLQLADGSAAGGGYSNFESKIAIADGAWHYVAVTVERGSTIGIRWYLDGVLVPAGTANPTFRKGSLANASPLRFGRRTLTGDGPGWFKGTLDEWEIYARALTPQEIADVFGASTAGRCK